MIRLTMESCNDSKSLIGEWTGHNYTSDSVPCYSVEDYRTLKDYALELDPDRNLLLIYTSDYFNPHFENERKKFARAKQYHPEWFEIGTPIGQLNVYFVARQYDKNGERLFNQLEKKALSLAK